MAQLTDRQIKLLQSPLDTGRVQFLKKFSYLEQWDVRRYLTRVFGFTGWGVETLELTCISERHVPNGDGFKHTIVYRAQVRLTVKDTDGSIIGQWEDGAAGDAINQPSLGDAHDLAMKTALSQALKRCAANLGDQFGLSLYNGGDTRPVVHWSVAYPKPTEIPPDEPVKAEPTVEQVDAELDDRINQAVSTPVQNRSEPSGSIAATPARVMDEAQARFDAEMNGDADGKLTTAELEYAAAYGPDEVSNAALNQLDQLTANARAVAYREMHATAVRVGFSDQLPAQFLSSFGVDIMSGATEQYHEATRIMNGGQP